MCDGDMTIGEKLARLVQNQSRLSRDTGLTQSAISDAISGKRRLYVDQAAKIARALRISLDYLTDDAMDDPPMSPDPRSEDEEAVLLVYRSLRLSKEEAIRRLAGYGQVGEGEELRDARRDNGGTGRRGDAPPGGRGLSPRSGMRGS